MGGLAVAFAASFAMTLLIVAFTDRCAHLSHDHDFSGPQKFHARAVPRIGGLSIFVGICAAAGAVLLSDREAGRIGLALVVCGAPAFFVGLAEDLTKRVSARRRLLATAVSAALAIWAVDSAIVRTDIPGLDWLVASAIGAALVTVFVVAGVANSVNIIDGFNGLASMCAMLMLAGLGYVAYEVGDTTIALLALAGIGALLGFFVLNFPAGLVFLGDGGAYFAGFCIAELAILLLYRNPSVSPLCPLLICIYPVFETLFSIYRRRVLREASPGIPDGIHLHSLIYRRVLRRSAGDRSAKMLTRCNSMTSPYLWVLCALALVPALLWWDSTAVMVLSIALFGIVYTTLYWRIVRFRAPRWLGFRLGRVDRVAATTREPNSSASSS